MVVRRECPEVSVECEKFKVKALIDTGSEVSAIDEELFRKMGEEGIKLPIYPMNKCFLICANNKRTNPITKQTLVTVKIGNREVEVVCLVVKNLIRELILGTDWLTDAGAVIDFRRKRVQFYDHKSEVGEVGFPACALAIKGDEKESEFVVCERELEKTVSCLTHLSAEEKQSLLAVLWKHRDVFSDKPGLAKDFVHRIRVVDDSPYVMKSYPIPHAYESQVDEQINVMIKEGIIKKAPSPYINPLVVVAKSNNKVRLCVDARKLNRVTIPEHDEPPRVDELLRKFHGTKFFSTTDCTSAYWQMRLHPNDQKYTAFIYKSVSYVFQRVPYGLKNSGAAMIRCLDAIVGPEARSFATIYVDDLLISSPTFDKHLEHLEYLFKRFKAANVTLKLSKSKFCRLNVPFVGHILTPEGVKADEEKIAAVQRASAPKNIKQLRSFLGLCNYYARFCHGYAHVIAPLRFLLKKGVSWKWTPAHQASFENVKKKFLETVMIQYPDFTKPMFLQTDSSGYGIGAVLFQKDNEMREKVIAFISRALKGSELSYTTTEKEALAVVWALQKLRTTILGSDLTILTDHKALTFLLKCKLNNSRLTRWTLALQEYDFKIEYCTGKENVVPDWLSRTIPEVQNEGRAACEDYMVALIDPGVMEFPRGGILNLSMLQVGDIHVGRIHRRMTNVMDRNDPEYDEVSRLAAKCRLIDNIVYKRLGRTREEYKVWVPRILWDDLVWHAHTKYGHCGVSKVVWWLHEKYYWPKMGRYVRMMLRSCDLCQRVKHPNRSYEGPMANIIPIGPKDLYAVDIYGALPKGRKGNKYIFVIIDVFTKFVQVYPLTKPTSRNCLRVLFNAYFPLCGVPRRILSDHGSQFTSREWKEELGKRGVQVIYSSIRRPQTNPSERIMRELSRLFRTFCSENHTQWVELVPWVNKWFNELCHESTGLTPVEAHFGHKPSRDDDGLINIPGQAAESRENLTRMVLRKLDEAGKKRKQKQKGKTYSFCVGDRVLLKSPRPSDTRQKLFHKFFHLYTGPFRISRFAGPNACYLEDDTRGEIGIYNFGNLKVYHEPI